MEVRVLTFEAADFKCYSSVTAPYPSSIFTLDYFPVKTAAKCQSQRKLL